MKCRICGRAPVPREHKAHPFCSYRCQLADLGAWLGEEYRIPVEDDEDEDGTSRQPGAAR